MEKALHSLYGRSFVREDHLTGRLLIGHCERTTGDGIEMGQSEEEGLNGEHKKKDEGEEENKGTAPSVSYPLEKGMALSLFGCFLSLSRYTNCYLSFSKTFLPSNTPLLSSISQEDDELRKFAFVLSK